MQPDPGVKEVPVPVVPVLEGVTEDATGEVPAEVATLGATDAIGAEATGAEVGTGASVFAGEAAVTMVKAPPAAVVTAINPPVADAQPDPVGDERAVAVGMPRYSRESPGSGKMTSAEF